MYVNRKLVGMLRKEAEAITSIVASFTYFIAIIVTIIGLLLLSALSAEKIVVNFGEDIVA